MVKLHVLSPQKGPPTPHHPPHSHPACARARRATRGSSELMPRRFPDLIHGRHDVGSQEAVERGEVPVDDLRLQAVQVRHARANARADAAPLAARQFNLGQRVHVHHWAQNSLGEGSICGGGVADSMAEPPTLPKPEREISWSVFRTAPAPWAPTLVMGLLRRPPRLR